jgi:hypothetical protein
MRAALAAICFLAASIAGSTGVRALDAGKVDAIVRAADAFAELAKGSHTTGRPPRQTDPAAAPLLNTAFDTAAIKETRVPWSELLTLNKWNLAIIKIGVVYMLAGTGVSDIEAAGTTPGVADRVDRNTATFAPELGRYFDAQLHLQGAIMNTVQEFLRTASRTQLENAQFKAGLGQIRSGVAQTVTGMLGTFTVEGVADDWRRARLVAAFEIAPTAVKFLPPEEQRSVRTTAEEIAGKMQDATVKSRLNSFAKMFGQQ